MRPEDLITQLQAAIPSHVMVLTYEVRCRVMHSAEWDKKLLEDFARNDGCSVRVEYMGPDFADVKLLKEW